MKRLSPRELLLVMAPLGIICLGIWGAQLREQHWPTRARIAACRVRPATPFEVWQGHELGVTVEAVVPLALSEPCNGSIKYSLFDAGKQSLQASTADETRSAYRGNYFQLEQKHAYKWAELTFSPSARTAEVTLFSGCNAFPPIKQQFKLLTADVVRAVPKTARQANFRVTKATLQYLTSVAPRIDVILDVQDLSDQSQGLVTFPRCVGEWRWQTTKSYPITYSAVGSTAQKISQPGITEIDIHLEPDNWQLPLAAGTKIRGMISSKEGWPQEIEVEWPKILDPNHARTEMKFSTKLAPLPTID